MRKVNFFIRFGVMCAALSAVPAFLFSFSCPGGQCGVPFGRPSALPNVNFESFRTAVSSEFQTEFAASHPSVVRILVENAKTRNYGTGTWIQLSPKRCAVLTCAHLFETDRPVRVSVYFPNQPALDVQIQAIDRKWDVALLQMESGTGSFSFPRPLHLTDAAPRQGEYIRSCGYGSDGRTLWMLSIVRGYCRLDSRLPAQTLVLAGNARPGDSGAPMMKLDGSVAGVLWGTDGHSMYGTWSGQILKVFETAFQENFRVPLGIHETEKPELESGRRENVDREHGIERFSESRKTPDPGKRNVAPENTKQGCAELVTEQGSAEQGSAEQGSAAEDPELLERQEFQSTATRKKDRPFLGKETKRTHSDRAFGKPREFASGRDVRGGETRRWFGGRNDQLDIPDEACLRSRKHADPGTSEESRKRTISAKLGVGGSHWGKGILERKISGQVSSFVERILFVFSLAGNFLAVGILIWRLKRGAWEISRKPETQAKTARDPEFENC